MAENKDIIIEEITVEEDSGKVTISDEVIATISGIAALEVDGVTGMAGTAIDDIAEKLGAKKSPGKGVKVVVDEAGAAIDIFVVVEFGRRIPELSWEVQENVKNSVETMTGIDVRAVNVRIEGVSFPKEAKENKKAENKDSDVKEVELESLDIIDEITLDLADEE